MDAKRVLGNNDIDDVRWLCSLTDSELDLLVSLKNMYVVAYHASLLCNPDILCVIFMEHLKGQLIDVPVASSNLFKQNVSGSFARMTDEDLYPYVCSNRRKRVFGM
ncbi:hypothetical protein SASPL_100268 [Salvia splendens]|uniref:Uncharacterized protein n=1 Tax=Salvia splendens TaxID=180675 RepID=A0A8X8YMY8_SALSN|nr:hypothetical protein SASPL_100268 [Salvia splendens]